MKEYSFKQLLVVAFSTLIFFGCHMATTVGQGMLNENNYFSSRNPNIQIIVDKTYTYSEEKHGYDHSFVNNDNHRLVYINYDTSPSQRRMEYYYNPNSWIFNKLIGSIELDKGETEILGKKWYYRDCVFKPNTATCIMIRDICRFTSNYCVLKIIYVIELPPYACNQWKISESFTDEQKVAYDNFLNEFDNDIKFTKYIKVN